MDSERDRKRRFKLFFEYLSRNKQYQDCWKWHSDHYSEHDEKPIKIIDHCPYYYDNFFHHKSLFGNPNSPQNIDGLYHKHIALSYDSAASAYHLSDDINAMKYLLLLDAPKGKMPLELTTVDFIKAVKNILGHKDNFLIRVNIDSNYSLQEITAAIQDIIRQERETRKIQQAKTRSISLTDLERYLKVYTARNTMIGGKSTKWEKVSELIYPKYPFEEIRLNLLSDNRIAKKIIDNSINCRDPRDFPLK